MPIFTYRCSCGFSFEKLVGAKEKDAVVCSKCGQVSKRDGVELFATASTIDPANKVAWSSKEVDLVVGADSSKRWEEHDRRFQDRTKDMVTIETGIQPGASFNPEKIIGTEASKAVAAVYEEAVKNGDPAVKAEWVDKIDPAAAGMKKLDV